MHYIYPMRLFASLLCFILAGGISLAYHKHRSDPLPGRHSDLRILGYINGRGDLSQYNIDFSRITDLDIAFLNPDSMGVFSVDTSLANLVTTAHSHHVRIYFSIGGGMPPAYMGGLLKGDKRNALAHSVAELAVAYHFDGVDADLENELVNSDYGPFISTLSTLLKRQKISLTAALAAWNANLISDSTMAQFDFINIMSYDKTGPWDMSEPGQHAPYSMAEQDFKYFNKIRKVPSGRLLIGVPFYGYGFGNHAPSSMGYKDIVSNFPGAANADSVVLPGGGIVYYNGIPTIKKKVQLAISQKAAGVMIWQILQDSQDSTSLLRAIRSAIP